jgi:hypothetical protein
MLCFACLTDTDPANFAVVAMETVVVRIAMDVMVLGCSGPKTQDLIGWQYHRRRNASFGWF